MQTNFKSKLNQMSYIRNLVVRHYKGSTKCMICGTEKANILHNEEDPYNISFVCLNCKTDSSKAELENLPKINISQFIDSNRRNGPIKNVKLTISLILILENALNYPGTMMNYLKENNLSLKKYKKLIELYEKEVKPIEKSLKLHFNANRAASIQKQLKNKATEQV